MLIQTLKPQLQPRHIWGLLSRKLNVTGSDNSVTVWIVHRTRIKNGFKRYSASRIFTRSMTSCDLERSRSRPDTFKDKYLNNSTSCSNGSDTTFHRTYSCFRSQTCKRAVQAPHLIRDESDTDTVFISGTTHHHRVRKIVTVDDFNTCSWYSDWFVINKLPFATEISQLVW